jgi:O-antigen/teichoic acid export membrane protein
MSMLQTRNTISPGRRALRGVIWMVGQNVVGRVSGLLTQLGLAILLTPADFGVIGLTYTVTGIVSTLMNVGIDDVLLRRREALRLWVGPATWISFGLALFAGALVAIISPLAADIYKAPMITGLLLVSAVTMPIGALSSVPMMILRARMRFGTIALCGTLETVIQAILTLGFAWLGFGAYSFVLPPPILWAVKAMVLWRLTPIRISRLRFQFPRWKYLLGNTGFTFLTRSLIAILSQGDYVVLGLMSTPQVVGVYYFGFRLAAQPLSMLAGSLSGILYPTLAQFKSDPARQGRVAVRAATLLFFCLVPVAFMQAATTAPLVLSFFGTKWAASIPIIQMLSIAIAIDAVSWLAGTLFAGALLDQAVGVACGVCIFYATKPAFVYLAFRRIGVTPREIAAVYLKPISLSLPAIGVSWAISQVSTFDGRPLTQILVVLLLGTTFYIGLLRRFAPDIWQELSSRLVGGLRPQVVRIEPQTNN